MDIKGAWHDAQHHPPNFFKTHCDFGTKGLVIFFWLVKFGVDIPNT